MNPSEHYVDEELLSLGFTSVGKNVRISRKVSFYALAGSVGSDVRIDDFTIIKGRVVIGSYVHVAAHCLISGVGGEVRLGDCSTLSDSVSIYTASDDYRANSLSSSTVPERYLTTVRGDVTLGRGSLVGSHSLLLPGTSLGDASSVGALCVIRGVVTPGAIIVSRASRPIEVGRRDVEKILRMTEELLRSDGT